MMPKNDRSLQAKETALLALAQGDPDFPAFLDRYRQALPQVAALPAELVEELMAAVEEDPALGELAKSYEENAQAAQTYALLGVPEMTVLFAGLFLLGAHINPPDPGGQVGIPAGAPQHAGRPPGKNRPDAGIPVPGIDRPIPGQGRGEPAAPAFFQMGIAKFWRDVLE